MTKKKGKGRIPKRIGGLKIPKELRQTGEMLIDSVVERAQSPQGREMMAGALTMAAAAMAKRRDPFAARTPEAGAAPDPASSATPPPPRDVSREPDFAAIADTISATAEMMLGRLFGAKKA